MKHSATKLCVFAALTALAAALVLPAAAVRAEDRSAGAAARTAVAKAASGPAATVPATEPAKAKVKQFRGFSLKLDDPAAVEDVMKSIDELAEMGCTSMNFVIAAQQKDVHSDTITIPWGTLPPLKDIKRILKHARDRKMLVMLMPIVLLEQSGPKEWRGVIAPEDWDAWFASYTKFITTMARLARECDVEVLMVGSELLSTETFKERWTNVIKEVRKNFIKDPNGVDKKRKLAYSANWDHYHVVSFWDQLDYIAMNNYHELANKPGVPVDELVKKWEPIKNDILKFVKEKNKPFFFSEVGWHNVQNTLKEPWNYVAEGKIDLGEQERAYRSFVKAWEGVATEQYMGAFIWEWRPNIDGSTRHGTYCLQKTPALEVVKEWMKGAEWTPADRK